MNARRRFSNFPCAADGVVLLAGLLPSRISAVPSRQRAFGSFGTRCWSRVQPSAFAFRSTPISGRDACPRNGRKKVVPKDDRWGKEQRKRRRRRQRRNRRKRSGASKFSVAWAGPRARPCRYPWISVGVLGTDGGHSGPGYIPLYSLPSPPVAHSPSPVILLPPVPPRPLPSRSHRRGGPLSLRPSFSVALLFIYSFGPAAAALCPSARRLVGCSLGWTLNVAPSNTSAQGILTYHGRDCRRRVPCRVGTTHLTSAGPANFGYSHRQYAVRPRNEPTTWDSECRHRTDFAALSLQPMESTIPRTFGERRP